MRNLFQPFGHRHNQARTSQAVRYGTISTSFAGVSDRTPVFTPCVEAPSVVAGRRASDWSEPKGACTTAPERRPARVEFVRYSSAVELRQRWAQHDTPCGALQLSILLVLSAEFDSYVPDVVRRRHRASRLLIASTTARLPGSTSRGDLAMSAGGLGWLAIGFEPDLARACSDTVDWLQHGERCVIFWPSSLDVDPELLLEINGGQLQ